MVEIIALLLFIAAYFLISFEGRFRTSKSAIALVAGGFLWILVIVAGKSKSFIEAAFQYTGNEILGIIMFLLASMALVEVLSHHHLFDWLRERLLSLKFSAKRQFILLAVITFFLSALLDNMTVGLLMAAVAKQFFKGKNLLVAAAGIVIASNAGGSWSPIGDVTTVLLWIAGKYDSFTILREGFLPATVFLLVAMLFLIPQLHNEELEEKADSNPVQLTKNDKVVITTVIATFLLPIFANTFGIPPYIALLFGLGIVWIFLQLQNRITGNDKDIMDTIFHNLDLASINFYAGILLAANVLYTLGILDFFSKIIFGVTQNFFHVVWGSVAAGLIFATFDNIPLTALSLKLINLNQQSLWVLLALTIGNGGSTLVMGSAAGIAVMGSMKELTVGKFFKIASLGTLIAYAAMVAVWFGQYFLFLR